jgi:hypothetical protein
MSSDRGAGDDVTNAGPIAEIELSAAESWALLRESGVGRLAVIVDDRPEIFPVNHLVDHGSVVLRTALGTKFRGAVGHWVAFEADGYDPETGSAWSVVLKGEGQEVNRLYDVLEVIELPLFPWDSAPKSHFIRIEPHSITGRRFEVAGGARSAGAAETVRPAGREPAVQRPTS